MSGKISEIVIAVSQPAMKLIECVRCAVGAVYEPRKIRKLTDARTYEIEKISQSLRENADISIHYEDSKIVLASPCYEDLARRAGKRLAFQEMRKQENMETVIELAFDELQRSTDNPKEDVDLDWVSRFLNYASNVSDKDLQLIWSKILAEEILRPNSSSLRVLSVLEKISKEEALLFKRLSKYFIPQHGLFTDGSILNDHSIKYSDILKLNECGLMNSDSDIANIIELQSGSKSNIIQTKQFVLIGKTNKSHKTVHVRHYRLTEAGMKLHEIISSEEPDMNYSFLVFITKSLINAYKDCTFSLHKIVSYEGGIVNFNSTPMSI